MDLNDDTIQTCKDLDDYGERIFGSLGYVDACEWNDA